MSPTSHEPVRTAESPPHIPLPEDEPTMDVVDAGRACGLGRDAAYLAANRYLETGGEEGLPVIRFGRYLRCPTAAVRQLLGLDAYAGAVRVGPR